MRGQYNRPTPPPEFLACYLSAGCHGGMSRLRHEFHDGRKAKGLWSSGRSTCLWNRSSHVYLS